MVSASTCVLIATSACGTNEKDAAPDDPVTIGVTVSNATEPYVIPWLVGQQQGFFANRGVIIDQIVPSKGGSTTLRNMLSGDLPIADIGLTSVIESIGQGAPVRVVGGAVQSAYGLDFYAMSDRPIQSIKDIKVWAYTSPESVTQALTYILPQRAGVRTDVQRVASGGVGEGIALLESGDVDVTVVPPSVAAKDTSRYREVVTATDYLKAFQQSVIATTPEYSESHPATVRAVLAGYQESVDWITAHPAEAGAVYAKYSDLEPKLAGDIVERALKQRNWGVGFNAEAIKVAIEAKRLAGSDADADVCSVFFPEYLPAGAGTELPADC
jgi:NitT/TauT family transport system substrate-binding protein